MSVNFEFKLDYVFSLTRVRSGPVKHTELIISSDTTEGLKNKQLSNRISSRISGHYKNTVLN